MTSILRTVISALVVILLPCSLFAQGLSDIDKMLNDPTTAVNSSATKPKITAKQATEALAATHGVNPQHPQLKSLEQKGRSPSANRKDLKVIKHFSFTGGMLLPTKEEIDKQFATVRTDTSSKEYQEKMANALKVTEGESREQVVNYPLSRCSSAKTKKATVGPKMEVDMDRVQFDVLFLADKSLANLAPGAFGDSVKIHVYDPTDWALVSMAKSFGFECLPARLRATKQFSFVHHGKDSFRNFDDDINGAGKLTKEVLKAISSR